MSSDFYHDDPQGYFESNDTKRATFSNKLIGFSLLIGLTFLGNSLAANINLGTNRPFEFGQGVLRTNSCSSNITVAPSAIYKNNLSPAKWYLSGFKISNVPNTCLGKLFDMKIYNNTGEALQINGANPFNQIRFHFDNSAWIADVTGCLMLKDYVFNSASNNYATLDLTPCFDDPNYTSWANATNDIYKFTLETRENTVFKVFLNYTKSDGYAIGEIYKYSDQAYDQAQLGGGSFPLFIDSNVTRNFVLYIQVPDAVYGNNTLGPSYYTLSITGGTVCNYLGFAAPNANSRVTQYTPFVNPLNAKAVEYSCTGNGAGSVVIS